MNPATKEGAAILSEQPEAKQGLLRTKVTPEPFSQNEPWQATVTSGQILWLNQRFSSGNSSVTKQVPRSSKKIPSVETKATVPEISGHFLGAPGGLDLTLTHGRF